MILAEHHSQDQIGMTLFPQQQWVDFFQKGKTAAVIKPKHVQIAQKRNYRQWL